MGEIIGSNVLEYRLYIDGGSQVPKSENEFWKRDKIQVIYIEGKKSLPVKVGWKGKRMRVLHKMYVGSTYMGHTVISVTKRVTEEKKYQF